MKAKFISLLLLLFVGVASVKAQTFYKPNNFNIDATKGHAVAYTGDGGTILAGYDPGYSAVFVVKSDAQGNITWDYTYRVAGKSMIPHDVIQVGSHGYLISGRSETTPFAPFRLMISPTGSVLWAKKTAGNWFGSYLKSYYDFSNNRILSTGHLQYFLSSPYRNVLFSSIRPDGTAAIDQFIRLENTNSFITGIDLTRALDGGVMLIGSRTIANDANDEVYVVKLAATSYAVQWAKKYKPSDGGFSTGATTISGHYDLFGGNHGYIIGGVNNFTPSPLLPDAGFLFRINDAGAVVWSRKYERPVQDVMSYWYGGIHATGNDGEKPYISKHNIANGTTSSYKEYGHQFNAGSNSGMRFTSLSLRFTPGSFWPSGLRAGGYYPPGSDRLLYTDVDFNLNSTCFSHSQSVSDFVLTLQISSPDYSQITLSYPTDLSFYPINRGAKREQCGDLMVNIQGIDEECYEFIGTFPIFLNATSSHANVNFSWQLPPGFTGTIQGSHNQLLRLTGAPAPPPGGSFTDYIYVTGSYGVTGGNITATANHPFTVNDCDGGFIRKRAEDPAEQVLVAPNPATSAVSVRIPATELPATVQVISLAGEVVLSRSVSEAENRFDLNGLARGLYFIEVQGAQERYTQKLVLQ